MLRKLHRRFFDDLTFNVVTHSSEFVFIASNICFSAFDIKTLAGYRFERNDQMKIVALDYSSGRNVFMSCSDSGTVSFWDLKTRHGLVMASPPDKNTLPSGLKFLSGSVSVDGNFLSCGSESVDIQEPKAKKRHKSDETEDTPSAYVLIWDSRKLDHPMTVLSDIHSDSVNHLSFHATQPELLLTCSDDGLVNICNISLPADDGLSEVFNAESPVNRCGWAEPNSSTAEHSTAATAVYSLSNMQTLFKVWPLQNDDEDFKEDSEWRKITKNYSGKRILTACLLPSFSTEYSDVNSKSPFFCLLSTTDGKKNLRASVVHSRGSSLLCSTSLTANRVQGSEDDSDVDVFYASFLHHSFKDPAFLIAVSRHSIHHYVLSIS